MRAQTWARARWSWCRTRRTLGRARRQLDPFRFVESEEAFDLPDEQLLELRGWTREKMAEGWRP